MDLRKRIFADCDAGLEVRQVAVKYNVSESWIRRLRQRRRESGETAPRPRKKSPPKWLPYAESLKQFVADRPDATLAEVKEQLAIPLSIPTLCRALRALRLTFKKKSSAPRSRTGRTFRSGAPTGGSGKQR
jgi:transposase